MVVKRVPRHPMISEAMACSLIMRLKREIEGSSIASSTTDASYHVIVLASIHRLAPFGAYPCARELRSLMRSLRARDNQLQQRIKVAYIDGGDGFAVQSAMTFFSEGASVFAREPRCG
jgi:hypothetical protein